MQFCDLALSKRLERAEGHACVQYAVARRRLFPSSGAEWMECAGTYAVFDGVDSPVTQTFGLGIFHELSHAGLDRIESFFLEHDAPVFHEVSPFAGAGALDLLCSRNYKPVEVSNILCMTVERPEPQPESKVTVRRIVPEEAQLWADTSAKGWAHEHPELLGFFQDFGVISAAREHSPCFLAEIDGLAGAAGVLSIHDGVALFGGSATVPELRRKGLQTALLHVRMSYAFEQGCNLAMIAVEPGSDSQRNAERKGFRIAYTRIKWRLFF